MSRAGIVAPIANPAMLAQAASTATGSAASAKTRLSAAAIASPIPTTSSCRGNRSATTPPASTPSAAATRKPVSIAFAAPIDTPNAATAADGKNVCNPTWATDSSVK